MKTYYELMRDSNPLLCAPITDALATNKAEIIAADTSAALALHLSAGVYLSLSRDINALLPLLPKKREFVLCALGVDDEKAYADALNPRWITACYQSVYAKKEPIPFDFAPFNIKKLDLSYAPTVLETYSLKILQSVEDAEHHINLGMYGAFDNDGSIMGYIGKHTEGSLGLLEVLPPYRNKGVGTALEIFMLNTALLQGLTPYGHVVCTNEKSLKLQKKLGMTILNQKVIWYGVDKI